MRIFYGGKTIRGGYTNMHKNRATTSKRPAVLPIVKPSEQINDHPPQMSGVIKSLERLSLGSGVKKKRVTFSI